MERKTFLKYSALGSAFAISTLAIPSIFRNTIPKSKIDPNFKPDIEIEMKAGEDKIQIFKGTPTKVWRYKAKLLKGPSNSVMNIENSYLGPILKVRYQDKIRIIFQNDIPEKTIVHWHGLHVPSQFDGHPIYAVNRGEKYVYEFEIKNRAGTYWFHPHPNKRTGPQVYYGLAGLFIIEDDEEKKLNLPSDKNDIPIIIQDRNFDSNNQFVYVTHRMQKITGFVGDTILVNGKPGYELSLGTSSYRLRILNGSNSRIYKLAWSDGTPLTVIGTDGGLLEQAVVKNYVMLGPAERIDVWLDLSNKNIGDELILKSLKFEGGGMIMGMGRRGGMMRGGMMRGGMMRGGMMGELSGESELNLLKIKITRKEKNKYALPSRLSKIVRFNKNEIINLNNPRTFVFSMMHMTPTINGRTFKMTETAKDEIVRLNTTEMWKFVNSTMGMQMPHPVHVHDVQFQIVERTPSSVGWNSIKDGFIDNGWKDTVLLMPGMEIKVVMRFEDYSGLYLYHCHNLEHEDLGMMRNFLIKG